MRNNELIKKINRVFHDEEAILYDQRHPEILKEKDNWQVFCQRHLKQLPRPTTVLDIGTGTGFVPSILAEYLTPYDKVICTDISSKMLNRAREKLENFSCQFDYIETDCEKIPLADSTIDLITVNSTLHHLPDYYNFFKEVDRLLKPKGVFCVMHEPNKKFFKNPLLFFFFRLLGYILSKLKKNKQGRETDLFERVSNRLLNEKITKKRLSAQEIQSLVDIHSPTASPTINKKIGFNPSLIKKGFPKYKLILIKTYNHLGKLDPDRNLFLKYLNKLFSFLFPKSGSSFYLILKK
jgi:ubiquinone/menaquinone biosynthesis C-methylase UbiE